MEETFDGREITEVENLAGDGTNAPSGRKLRGGLEELVAD